MRERWPYYRFEDAVPIAATPEAATPGQEVAVPENDPTEDVTGCDNNVEQEGECEGRKKNDFVGCELSEPDDAGSQR